MTGWAWDPTTAKLTETGVWSAEILTLAEKRRASPLPLTAFEGDRHATLLRIAGALRRQGADAPTMLAALRQWNTDHCDPPKEDHLLIRMAEDLEERYPPEPDGILTGPGDSSPGLHWVTASEVVIGRARWTLAERVPRSAVTVLGGEGGLGKSTWTCHLAAQLTTGTAPGDFYGTPRRVLVSSAEDTWEQVIVPRLKGAGADLTMVSYLALPSGIRAALVPISEMVSQVTEIARGRGDVALWIIDPFVAFIDQRVDTHRDHDVRAAVVAPLTALAQELAISVLGVMHLNKKADRETWERLSGSAGFYNGARAMLLWGMDPDVAKGAVSDRRVLVMVKSNYGRLPAAELYTLGETLVGTDPEDRSPIMALRAVLTGTADLTASQVINGRRERTKAEQAETIVREALAPHGWIPAGVVIDLGLAAGVSERTMKRARTALGLKRERLTHDPDPLRAVWCWRRRDISWPPNDPVGAWPECFSDPQNPRSGEVGPFGAEGAKNPASGLNAPEGAKPLAPSRDLEGFLAPSPRGHGPFDEGASEGANTSLPGDEDDEEGFQV